MACFLIARSSSQRNASGMCDEVTMNANPAYEAVAFDGKTLIIIYGQEYHPYAFQMHGHLYSYKYIILD